ncbi:tyrosine recombinase XerC [Parafrankia sp. EUN1f]|uniref:site-specific integrase n=1 Tax=Parafrankia sp. EUN1f TaxID=102897 RepID=UPI001E51E8AD|nr:tyrosine-type recombinase/integrase [Parafrankia sp. EUN1f]
MPLTGLRAHHISKAYQRIEEVNREKTRPTGPGTIALVHATLRNALNDARDQRMISFNPAAGVELPEYTRPEVEPWEAHEVGAFLDEAATDRLAAMWELIALHGLRRGEACGATWEGMVVDPATVDDPDGPAGLLTITQQITENSGQHGVWPPKTRSGKRKVDVDATTLGSLLAHRVTQEQEREQIGAGWDNGTLPDQAGRPVRLSGLMFTRPEGLYLPPEWVSARIQQIARTAGLMGTVRLPAAVNDRALVIGVRSREPVGVWTVYRDREPLVQVEVTAAERIQGNRTRLALSGPLPVAVEPGDEIGRALLSRRRLHDLRHSSASIQLAGGIDLAIVSKRLGHSSPAITGSIYAHLLRPAGQRAARTVAAAIPRRRPDVPTTCPRGSSGAPSGSSQTF